MKIAVACENDEVFQHFGHTPEFAIFEVEEGRLNGLVKVPTGECGHGALAGFLKDLDVRVLICGGIGPGAQEALADAGIQCVGGTQGNIIQVIGDYLKGLLKTDPAAFTCHHHDQEGGHSCGGHDHASCGHSRS